MKRIVLVLVSVVLIILTASTSLFAQSQISPFQSLPPTVPETQKFTLAQTQDSALRMSPLIKAAAFQVAGARANLSGQRVPVNPVFNISGLNNTVNTFDLSNPSNYSAIFTVETNGGIGWRTSQARNQLLGIQADGDTTRLSVQQAVSNAYTDLQVANSFLENEIAAYKNALRLSDLTEKQFSFGAAPETNAIRARIALTQEESSFQKAISDVRTARANLNMQMGRSPASPIDAADPLTFIPVTVSHDGLLVQAERSRPELRSAEFNRQALRAAVGLQRSQYYPNAFVGSDLKAIGDHHFQFGVALPLFDFGSIRGAVRQAQSNVKVQEEQAEATRQQVRLDVETAWLNLNRAQHIVQAFQDGILPRSESLLQRIEKGFVLGASTILDLIDAQNTYRSARNDYAVALGDYRRSLAQLERAVGGPLQGAK